MKESVYILGMAKSSLKLNTSGPRRNLELDVLRLIHFVNLFASKKVKVFAVMLVHNDEIKDLICNKWFKKYDFNNTDYFKVFTFEKNEHFLNNKNAILIEKENNSSFNNSVAILSEKTIEEILKNEIENHFKISNLYEIENQFSGIKWDYKELFKVYFSEDFMRNFEPNLHTTFHQLAFSGEPSKPSDYKYKTKLSIKQLCHSK